MSDEDLVRRGDVLTEVAKMWKWSVLAAAELEEAVNQIPSAQPSPDVAALVEALEWYGEQSRLCRLIHGEGDAGRNALQNDGGKKAHAALAHVKGGAA